MTIAQYLPQWLWSRWQKPAPQKARILSKKDWQILPTLPRPQRPATRFEDDAGPPGYPIYWRMCWVHVPSILTKRKEPS
jgi:hypothetical protein